MAAKKKASNACICHECDRERKHRGLCGSHYQQAWRMVADEETTWEELIELGLALRGHASSPVPMQKHLKAAKK